MSERTRLDYDRMAAAYDVRYTIRSLSGIAEALHRIARDSNAQRVLEVGCGTGRWIGEFGGAVAVGVDASPGMLGQARAKGLPAGLAAARANDLPFRPETFHLIFVVNAVHHFDDPSAFVHDCARLLAPGGTLAITGIDPRLVRRWYFYEYFETRERDLLRFPSFGSLVDAGLWSGLEVATLRVVARAYGEYRGRAVLDDPLLAKNTNSQLALLSDEQYQAGLDRIHQEIADCDADGQEAVFRTELDFWMLELRKPVQAG